MALPPAEDVVEELSLIGVSILAVAAGFFAAYWIYIRRWGLAARMTKGAQWLYDIVYHKYYVDEAYGEVIVKPLRALASLLDRDVEVRGIDRAVNGLAWLVGQAGEGLRRLQTGLVRNYALAMLVGVVAILGYFLLRYVLY
jgi:NADH-quinone oxidoreductase subunit L